MVAMLLEFLQTHLPVNYFPKMQSTFSVVQLLYYLMYAQNTCHFLLLHEFQVFLLVHLLVRTTSYFKIFLLSRRPCLYINRFYFQICQITRTTLQCTNRNIQMNQQSTVFCHNLSYHSILSSGLHTTIISCFSN